MSTFQPVRPLPASAPHQISTPYPIPGAPDLIMGDMNIYGYSTPLPLVDHPHDRAHQHQTFWRYLSHKGPDAKAYPNYPDVDVRDATSEYLIEIEVPGIKDSNDIACQWTSLKSLVVTGNVTRPAWKVSSEDYALKREQELVNDSNEPYLMVGERRIGAFRRSFYFPVEVETDKLSAKLEAGLLRLRVPKHEHVVAKLDSKINIEVQD